MHKNATKCNETIGKWCKNKHGASKIIDTFETYQQAPRTTRASIKKIPVTRSTKRSKKSKEADVSLEAHESVVSPGDVSKFP
jgi:hypothetical protein